MAAIESKMRNLCKAAGRKISIAEQSSSENVPTCYLH